MSSFNEELSARVAHLRERLADAREEQDELRESELLGDLETLIDIAGRSDIDTQRMEEVLEAETGTLPVIPDLTAPSQATGISDGPGGNTASD